MRYVPGKIIDYVKGITMSYGGEWMYISGEEYKGYYHKVGEIIYTGASHDDFSKKLIKYNPDPNYVAYINSHDFYLKEKYKDPQSYFPEIVDKDYERGNITRYFVKKRNDESAPIIEVEKKQYSSLDQSRSGINESYYKGIQLQWKISGPKNDVLKNGKIVTYGIEDTNKRTLQLKEQEMKNIKASLKHLTQFGRIIS